MPQKRYQVDQITPMLRRAGVELSKGNKVSKVYSGRLDLNYVRNHSLAITVLEITSVANRIKPNLCEDGF